MKAKKEFGIHDGREAKTGVSSRRRPAMLLALAGVLMLAIALSSVGLAAGSAAAPNLERSNEASAMRWARLGETYEAAVSEAAAVTMSQRYKAMATYYGADPTSVELGPDAGTARWSRLGEAYEAAAALSAAAETARAEAAAVTMSQRYKAMATYYGADPTGVELGPDAGTARWSRLGEAYEAAAALSAAAETARAEAAAVTMSQRYKAMAEYCNSQPVAPRALLCSADYGSFGP